MGKAMKAMKKAMKAMKAMKADGVEDEGGEGCRGGADGCCCGAGEEVRLLQDCGHAQHEAEEQASHEGTQGRQPLHQGAVCVQGKACFEDSSLPSHEEAQGDALNRPRALLTGT